MMKSILEWYSVETKKWTVFVLAMVCLTIAFVVIGVTLLDSQSAADKLIQQSRAERASHQQDNATFTATIARLESDIGKLANNQSLVLRRQAAEDVRQARILRFVHNHPGAPIPENLLNPVPVPTLQRIAAPAASAKKKAVPPKGAAQKGPRSSKK